VRVRGWADRAGRKPSYGVGEGRFDGASAALVRALRRQSAGRHNRGLRSAPRAVLIRPAGQRADRLPVRGAKSSPIGRRRGWPADEDAVPRR